MCPTALDLMSFHVFPLLDNMIVQHGLCLSVLVVASLSIQDGCYRSATRIALCLLPLAV
jgi:hypothetical protein